MAFVSRRRLAAVQQYGTVHEVWNALGGPMEAIEKDVLDDRQRGTPPRPLRKEARSGVEPLYQVLQTCA